MEWSSINEVNFWNWRLIFEADDIDVCAWGYIFCKSSVFFISLKSIPNDLYWFSSRDKINFKFKDEPKDIIEGDLKDFIVWIILSETNDIFLDYIFSFLIFFINILNYIYSYEF